MMLGAAVHAIGYAALPTVEDRNNLRIHKIQMMLGAALHAIGYAAIPNQSAVEEQK